MAKNPSDYWDEFDDATSAGIFHTQTDHFIISASEEWAAEAGYGWDSYCPPHVPSACDGRASSAWLMSQARLVLAEAFFQCLLPPCERRG